jgi:hypothetical protein
MKNGCECFDKLSMHGFSSGNSSSGPLVLSLSKDSERVFRQPASPDFSRLEKHKAALYGIKAVSPNSYTKGEERPYGDTVYTRTDGISPTGAARGGWAF